MDFTDRYKILPNTDLIRIIENPNKYQEKAVQTAKEILKSRNLSALEIQIAKDELEAER